ncbi:MAG TPA: recombination regulator RecX [Streptosporangiaceae bacterium]|jgi:regulatory protein
MAGRPRRRARRGGFGDRDGPTPGSGADASPPPDPESVARTICLRLLTAAPRTRAQLADELDRREVPADVSERVLSRFTEVGLIDDAAFAQAWVQSRHRGRGLARRALSAELRRRGVDDDTARDAVGQLDDDQEKTTARALVDRRLGATRGLPPQTRVRRLAGMLARKGYPAGVAFSVVREALAEEGADPGEMPDPDIGEMT